MALVARYSNIRTQLSNQASITWRLKVTLLHYHDMGSGGIRCRAVVLWRHLECCRIRGAELALSQPIVGCGRLETHI